MISLNISNNTKEFQNKIIVLTIENQLSRFSEQLYLKELQSFGYSIEVLFIGNLLFSLKSNLSLEIDCPYPFKEVLSYSELEKILKFENSKYVSLFIYVSWTIKFFRFFWLVSKFDLKTFMFIRGVLPGMSAFIFPLVNNIFCWAKSPIEFIRFINRAWRWYLLNSLVKIKILKKISCVFVAGSVAERIYSPIAKKLIHVPTHDYEKLNLVKNSQKYEMNTRKYAVFIDNNLAYHPDLILLKQKTVEANYYFQIMNTLFDKIEKIYNVRVIVAAHPSSQYHGNEFNDREIMRGDSAKLILNSEFVLGHMSTALSYAVICNKSIFFIDFEGFEIVNRGNTRRMLHRIARELNSYIIYINKQKEFDIPLKIPFIDKERYQWYLEKYIICLDRVNGETPSIVACEILNM